MIRPHARRYKWWRSCFNENTWIINNLSSNTAFLISLHLSSCPRHLPIDTASALESVSPPGQIIIHTLLFCYFIFMCCGKIFWAHSLQVPRWNWAFHKTAKSSISNRCQETISILIQWFFFHFTIKYVSCFSFQVIIINYTKVKIKSWSSIPSRVITYLCVLF